MKLKQSGHLLTSRVLLLVRGLRGVTLLNLMRILHNKGEGGKLCGASFHFCYVEACRKGHNVGVQHLLIGFLVVTIFLKATSGRMLKSVCPACGFSRWKQFSLMTFDLLLQRWCSSSFRNIPISWFTFQTPFHQISVAHFALQTAVVTEYKLHVENEFRANKRNVEGSFKAPLLVDIDFSGSWF